MSSREEVVEVARRVLKAIENRSQPSQADALTLRLWAGPRTNWGPLEQIAKQIVNAVNSRQDRPINAPP